MSSARRALLGTDSFRSAAGCVVTGVITEVAGLHGGLVDWVATSISARHRLDLLLEGLPTVPVRDQRDHLGHLDQLGRGGVGVPCLQGRVGRVQSVAGRTRRRCTESARSPHSSWVMAHERALRRRPTGRRWPPIRSAARRSLPRPRRSGAACGAGAGALPEDGHRDVGVDRRRQRRGVDLRPPGQQQLLDLWCPPAAPAAADERWTAPRRT